MGVAERSEVCEAVGGRGPDAAGVASPSSPGLAALALSLQRSAGNRSAAAWASAVSRQVQRKPKAKDPIDAFIAAKEWAKAADALSELPDAEIETRIKKLKPAQRERVMQGAREIERTAWTEPVITAMEKVDLRSANVGSLRWARASGFIARAGIWFQGLAVEDARKVAHELAFSRDQLNQIIAGEAALAAVFKDPWAYVPKAERMLYVMNLLVDTHGYSVSGAAGIVGNLSGESSLIPSRIEGSSEWSPTRTADFSGTVTDWTDEQIRDRDFKAKTGPKLPGVGLAQWTTKSRRSGFFARPEGTALLYDMDGQVAYLVDELAASFSSLDTKLRDSKTTVQAAADAFLEKFENPADPEASRSARRGAADRAAKLYNDAHAAAAAPAAPASAPAPAVP
jgi:Phage tail lysozyme